ncbi:unnamed protein product [Brassica oleracea]
MSIKSMAKCRCVSKPWCSIIRRPYYKVLFPTTKPPDPPRFLFTLVEQGKLFFYTSKSKSKSRRGYISCSHSSSYDAHQRWEDETAWPCQRIVLSKISRR